MQPCGNSSWCCTQYYPTVNAANKRKSNPKANLSLPRSMRHSYSAGPSSTTAMFLPSTSPMFRVTLQGP
ncbi:hypothetical protein SNK05_13695 [Fusarium graminearum]